VSVVARIGILGGSFDPPHAGHLAAAEAAQRQLGLEQVLVIPAARAPLRESGPIAPDADRLEWLQLTFAGRAWAKIDSRELRRGGVSYSVDTARELAAEHPGTELHWILGADQLSRLHLWRDIGGLCRQASFAVLARDGSHGSLDPSLDGLARITHLHAPEVAVSSSELRAILSAGGHPGKALLPGVAAAIQARNLYRN